jgi:hypothetical protein
MATRIAFGIPHRVGACACQIGKGREEPGIVEATESTTNWDNVVANKPLDPGHSITAVAYTDTKPGDGENDGVTSLATHIRCWTSYPEETGTDPKLIIKTKGDVAAGESGSFPSITITLRPLKTVLAYSYTGNANASGQGEIGYESQDPTQDTLDINYYEGAQQITNEFIGSAEYPIGVVTTGFTENSNSFDAYAAELGQKITLNETHYYKSADRPSTEPTPFQPLSGLEIDPTLHPRLPSLDAYGFKRDEAWDYRHRFPSDYFQKYGALTMPTGYPILYPLIQIEGGSVGNFVGHTLGSWVWTKHQPNSASPLPLNPLFEPDPSKTGFWVDEGIAPVVKGWYWDSNTPPGQTQIGWGNIFKSTAFKMTKEIRKRYPFSFVAKAIRIETVKAVDHTPGNQVGGISTQFIGEAGDPVSFFYTEPAVYTAQLISSTFQNIFQAQAWWRMEVDAELCGWNSKKTVSEDAETGLPVVSIVGAKIKGVIKLGLKKLTPSSAQYGLYSTQALNPGTSTNSYYNAFSGITPSFVFRCRVARGADYEVLEFDGGEIPWEVTLDEDNAKGHPIKFLDFPITSEVETPEDPSPTPGTVPDNTLVYIKDFIVTEVILP